ncbi:hypothetical protein CLOM_g13439 [Closterium sp. NIES-68]|nr:hypothetical protein CLOM_g13439 [Closterium sp. NIES-68]GJP72454.1 hypothetical protein CLOP_g3186 [Closterium sp. NIES-67]
MYRGVVTRSLSAVTRSSRRISSAAPSRRLHHFSSQRLPSCTPEIAPVFGSTSGKASLLAGCNRSRWIHPSFAARGFATSSSDAGLLKVLKAELEHEEQDYEPPEDLKEGPPAEWTVEEQGGTIDAVLRRAYQGEAISVVAAFADDEDAYGNEGEGEGESEEEEEEAEAERLTPLSVRVTVTKKAEQPELEIDCVVDGNSWIIQDVRLEDAEVPEDGIPYGGPQFSTLDPVLQEQFDSFLRRRGFSPALADYLRRYLEDKEQREYVRWLKRLGAFVVQK